MPGELIESLTVWGPSMIPLLTYQVTPGKNIFKTCSSRKFRIFRIHIWNIRFTVCIVQLLIKRRYGYHKRLLKNIFKITDYLLKYRCFTVPIKIYSSLVNKDLITDSIFKSQPLKGKYKDMNLPLRILCATRRFNIQC